MDQESVAPGLPVSEEAPPNQLRAESPVAAQAVVISRVTVNYVITAIVFFVLGSVVTSVVTSRSVEANRAENRELINQALAAVLSVGGANAAASPQGASPTSARFDVSADDDPSLGPVDAPVEIHANLGNTVIMITHDVDEAVLLSDRIVMMTNGPAATIGAVLDIELTRPRDRIALASDATMSEGAIFPPSAGKMMTSTPGGSATRGPSVVINSRRTPSLANSLAVAPMRPFGSITARAG